MTDPKTSWTQNEHELKPLPPEDWPSIDHIQTEDGAPADGVFSEKQLRLLTGTLYSSWKTDQTFSDESLRLFELQQNRLIPCPALPCSFPSIELGLTIWHGRFEHTDSLWLRWTTLNGSLIPTGEELALQEKQRADRAEQKAAVEKHRTEVERQRAEAEKQRADELVRETERLYRLLREKGIEDR